MCGNKVLKMVLVMLLSVMGMTMAAAAQSNGFVEGRDYKRVANSTVKHTQEVTVIEFFSFGCPWCNRVEPAVVAWEKTKPAFVHFEKVPVLFEPGWDVYARAYYTSKALGIEKVSTPKIFKAIHDEHQQLNTAFAMQRFFNMNFKTDPKKFDNIFSYSPSIDLQVTRGPTLMQKYNIFAVPTFVVNDQYEVNIEYAKGDNARFVAILNYLIGQSYLSHQAGQPHDAHPKASVQQLKKT